MRDFFAVSHYWALPLARVSQLRVSLVRLVICLIALAVLSGGRPIIGPLGKQLAASEIGFLEDFALAAEREAALQQLIPGTADYYYYRALHFQNQERFDEVDRLLTDWIKRYKYTPRVHEILNRQALLRYAEQPEASLARLAEQLKLRFDHQREVVGRKPNLPNRLDPALFSRDTLQRRALRVRRNTAGFESAAFEWLIATELDATRRRHLLSRLARPDYSGLVKLIDADLRARDSGGFGSIPIHLKMLVGQLDELLQLQPSLRDNGALVAAYLSKLQPSPDEDWQHDVDRRRSYLERLEDFVKQLGPVHNSLKAHVLYHRLALDRSQGVYDRQRFTQYLQLPRSVGYINRDYLKRDEHRRHVANLGQRFGFTLMPPIGQDEPLVRSMLLHFLQEAPDDKVFRPYIDNSYLQHVFAESKIVAGVGEPEQWYSLLPPAQYQALKDRVDLDFAAASPTVLGVNDPVRLNLHVKNVNKLIVKVFHINTISHYRQHLQEINTDIALDGLVANEESVYEYDSPPLRRVRRQFEFPQLARPGVYVIEFIGQGQSSRVVVRKGRLRHIARATSAGQLLTILNESHEVVENASVWLGGVEYPAGDDGQILLPYTNQPQPTPIVIQRDGRGWLATLEHQAEQYELTAGLHVDREQLLAGRTAELLVRASLTLNGQPVSLKRLENVALTIVSRNHENVTSTMRVEDFKLHANTDTLHPFQTPQRLARIGFTLQATVKVASRGGERQSLAVSETFEVNQIDRTEKIDDLQLIWAGGVYFLELIGRTGEPLADRAVRLQLKHRDFVDDLQTALQTDGEGRIELGTLAEIDRLRATGPDGRTEVWRLVGDQVTLPGAVHAKLGEAVELPYVGGPRATTDELSLLEVRGGRYVADHFSALKIRAGMLRIEGLPAGDFELLLKTTGQQVKVRVGEGRRSAGYVLGEARQLETRSDGLLHIGAVDVRDEAVEVQLHNADEFSRLHVIATRTLPPFSAYGSLAAVQPAAPFVNSVARRPLLYVEGRDIGEEYRYIIERQYALKFPGNMLDRPSLLLNPWAVRSTESSTRDAALGDAFKRVADPRDEASKRAETRGAGVSGRVDFSNLDFLSHSAKVLANLAPDKDGKVRIARKLFQARQHLQLVAVDPRSTILRQVSLPGNGLKPKDLRLAIGLRTDRHFTQQKQITTLQTGEQLEIADVLSSRLRIYDSLASVFEYYATLRNDAQLQEFRFILKWPELSAQEKREKYSRYACHELNFFLWHKDPAFFKSVVLPLLQNKRDRTFLDDWQLSTEQVVDAPATLQSYLQPWRHSQLNIVERILLSRKIEGEAPFTRRHVAELFQMIPPDIDRFNLLFETALQAQALDSNQAQVAKFFQGASDKAVAATLSEAETGFAGRSQGRMVQGYGLAMDDAGGESKGEALKNAQLSAPVPSPDATPAVTDGDADAERADLNSARSKLPSRRKAKAVEFFADRLPNESVRQLYRKLDQTKEWAENNYYQLPIEQQDARLVAVNAFWNDYAQSDPGRPFLSQHFPQASGNFTEALLALAVLDLPFQGEEHQSAADGPKFTLTAGSPVIAFHEQVRGAELAEATPILVSQNFFRHGDRFRQENNRRLDKFVTGEFLVHTVYGCQIVVTNPTSAPQQLEVLTQIPIGSLPVLGAKSTQSIDIELGAYSTQALEFHFYFPAEGEFPHYPVHVSRSGELLANAEIRMLQVVEKLSRVDRESWDYVSQNGTPEDVLNYLRSHNLQRTPLERIAFRMSEPEFFETVTQLLVQQHVYNHTLWSYSIRHNRPARIGEFLPHAAEFVAQCGQQLDSPLLVIDPVVRRSYQHLDYRPLVNARAHKLGARRQILNPRFHEQYHRLLKTLSYRRQLNDDDRMSVTYYMLLQDRVQPALDHFAHVDPARLHTRLQHDYFTAYLAFYTADLQAARDVAARYTEYPVDRWRNAFVAIEKQLDEIDGGDTEVTDAESRDQQQARAAAKQPSFEFEVESKRIHIDYQNVAEVQANYYIMDIELLFSRNPFVRQVGGQFASILPNQQQTIVLPKDKSSHEFPLPAELHNKNVLVELTAAGQSSSQPYYSNSMAVRLSENYGQLRVVDQDGAALPKVYVKVYARQRNGEVRFYKDGYTDLRGRFDYTSLNTNELDVVERFSLLVLSDANGAVVREAAPPQR